MQGYAMALTSRMTKKENDYSYLFNLYYFLYLFIPFFPFNQYFYLLPNKILRITAALSYKRIDERLCKR